MHHRAVHDAIRTSRVFRAPPAGVFAPWTEPETQHRWQPAPEGTQYHYESRVFSPGAVEICELRRGQEVLARFENRYLEIVENHRIVLSVRAFARDGTLISVSNHTLEFEPEGDGARLDATEQVVWLVGRSMRKEHEGGWATMLDRLVAFVDG